MAIEQGVDRLAVIVHARVHGTDERDVIDDVGEVRQQLADIHAALAVLLELPRAAHALAAGAGGIVVFHFAWEILAVVLGEFGLGIKQIHVARPALHEHGDHGLGLPKAMRHLGLQIKMARADLLRAGEEVLVSQQRGQSDTADAVGGAVKNGAAREHDLSTWRRERIF